MTWSLATLPFAGPLGSSSRRRRGGIAEAQGEADVALGDASRLENPDRFPIDAATFLAMHTVLVGAPSGKKSAYRQKDYVNMMMGGKVQRVPASPILALETPLFTVENALHALVREGYLEKIGTGRSTAYRRK